MPLTIGIALELAKQDERLDFLKNPPQVLASLPDPTVLLPLASAITGREQKDIAAELTAEKYLALQAEVEAELFRFFLPQRRELITRFRDAIEQESNASALSLLVSLQKTRPIPPGGPESGAPPESSASTPDHSPSDSSKTCETDTTATSGPASQLSEAGSSTANPVPEL